ncbi:potassium transporter 5-like isoform X2 [Tasmannia lanceolata]|uniref:potassium transporter 5-like isoform X2 n=1 Tax=Tasmannia lanceolata TaxID=3420 RepID=UPI00406396AB
MEEVSGNIEGETPAPVKKSNQNNASWGSLRRYNSLESHSANGHRHPPKQLDSGTIMQLAFQSIGIVYGDIGTSPLYTYSGIFPKGIKHNDDILGALSLIFYTITLIPVIKYVLIVLQANDNGEGGTFALYSLVCRYAKVGLLPSRQAEDRDVSNFRLELPNSRLRRASRLKSELESSQFAKYFLLFVTMLGTSMVIGDGVLTPCISVLSAVSGIKEATSSMTEGRIVWASIAVLVFLFLFQRFGTDKVGSTFAPIVIIWFLFIGGTGIFNFIKHDPSVIKAINPIYIVYYFKRNKKDAWISLGGVVLSITGAEAMFADLGHFSVRSIQISMCSMVYPPILLAYLGQSSYLRKHNLDVGDAFYKSIPGPMYWPTFVAAVLAAIIASQALISATFSIIQQSLSLGCFPRVKVIHTSIKYPGQVYIPEVNYLLMLACVAVTAGFKTTVKIGNAYGIAVVFVMTLTSSFLVLIMVMIWKTHILLVLLYVLVIGSVELMYLSSVLYKFDQGGYLPLAFVAVLMSIMFVWNYVYRKKYNYELENKVSIATLKEVASNSNIRRIPGIAFFYSELVQGIPPIFKQYVDTVPALHSVLVIVSIKSLPISKVPVEERFLFRRIDPRGLAVFHCVARYGYTDQQNESESFERTLVEKLKQFLEDELWSPSLVAGNNGEVSNNDDKIESVSTNGEVSNNGDRIESVSTDSKDEVVEDENKREMIGKEIELVEREWEVGVVHLMGENEVVAKKGSHLGKRVLIDYAFNFMKRNLRQRYEVLDIPHKRLLKVGMTYEL